MNAAAVHTGRLDRDETRNEALVATWLGDGSGSATKPSNTPAKVGRGPGWADMVTPAP